MRAVIMAGGRGSRLAPLTKVLPKPLLPLGDVPILKVMIHQLVHAGFDHITLTLGYMSASFHAFLAQNRSLNRLGHIDFVEEKQPTGTAGSLAFVPGLRGNFLVINGDILSNLDYTALIAHHEAKGGALTIGIHQKHVKIEAGVIECDLDGNVTEYVEKPSFRYDVSTGIYACNEEVLNHISTGEHLDFPVLVRRVLAAGRKVVTYPTDSCWFDLGRVDDLQRASRTFAQRRAEFFPDEASIPLRRVA